MIHCITWLWHQPAYRKRFTAHHVNTLRSMVARNLSLPHEFVCITDMPNGLDRRIRVLPLPKVPTVYWSARRPNCFRRLWAFSEEARAMIGDRIASFDLDCVVTGSLDLLVSRPEPFIIWRDTIHRNQYNGSFWVMTAGSRRQVWDEFKGNASLSRMTGKGSDQGWISTVLGPNEATFTAKDGVLSYKREVRNGALPTGAKLVIFHGKPDPWEVNHSWVRECYK